MIKTWKDILIGGFCSISWKSEGGWNNVDPKCVVFSITRKKVYQRINDAYNLYFHTNYSFLIGGHTIDIRDNKICGYADRITIKVPKNAAGEQELVEQPEATDVDLKDYEVFGVTN